jgi:3-oxoacyl-[acyl-carrier-protein] synthase-3
MSKIGISAIGSYVPEKKLTNADLEKMVETTDEWIVSRTGIRERRIAPDNIQASDMAIMAAQNCISHAKIKPEIIISSTGTGETNFPFQSSRVAEHFGLTNTAGFDLNAGCSGLIYAISAGFSLMKTFKYNNALITASEKMSYFTDYTDRASCILLGDGASSILLSSRNFEHEILAFDLGMDGTGSNLITLGAREGNRYFWQDGQKVFKFAVKKMCDVINSLKQNIKIGKNSNLFIIPHQANMRIFETVAARTRIPMSNFIINIDRFGNTSSASIGIALDEASKEDRFSRGDIILLIGFGAGLSWAGAAVRW